MKKTFSLITALVSVSLIGIIVIQISWLRSMMLLQEEQVKEKVKKALDYVGEDLEKIKGETTGLSIEIPVDIFSERFFLNSGKSTLVGKRYSSVELRKKIQQGFNKVGIGKMQFEYALLEGSYRTSNFRNELMSANYLLANIDTINNLSWALPLLAVSGSVSEDYGGDETLNVIAVNWKQVSFRSLIFRILVAVLFTIIMMAAFYLTVRTMLRQKKLGEIKNDFINNMTHEFKTPIATISLAVDALKNEKVYSNVERIQYFNSIIKEENQRMNRQVETILKASQMERNEADLNLNRVDVHEVIKKVHSNFALQLEAKNGVSNLSLRAANAYINADELHFSNLINNLIDNAIKYSNENIPLSLAIETSSDAKRLYISMQDNGIGMSRETVKRVFEKFYRAHTGNLHNVKGFGLGLSYVKAMVDAHQGEIKIESTLGKGSVFYLNFPLLKP